MEKKKIHKENSVHILREPFFKCTLDPRKITKKKESHHFDQELSLSTASSWSRATRKAEVL